METWKKSLDNARTLQNQGIFEESSYYLVNAIGSAPGNIELIKEFVGLLLAWAQKLKIEGEETYAFQHYERAEAFLVENVPVVSADDLPILLNMLRDTSQKKDTFSSEFPVEEDPRESQARMDLSLLKEGKFDLSHLGKTSDLQERLEKLRLVQDLTSNEVSIDNSSTSWTLADSDMLQQEINRLEMSLQFETVFEEAVRLLELARENPNRSVSVLLLQHVERSVGQLVTWPEKDNRQERVAQLLDQLRAEGDSLVEAGNREHAEAQWKNFNKNHDVAINVVKAWSSPSDIFRDEECKKQIQRIQDLMRALQEILPKLNDPEISRKAISFAEELSELMAKASQTQQWRYNKWAIFLLKDAMKEGDKHTGIIDDEPALGNSMKILLGPIDTRFLTPEVNRCYSEVFEQLFGHLDRPKNEQDFDNEGTKLNLLNDMFNKPKVDIQEF